MGVFRRSILPTPCTRKLNIMHTENKLHVGKWKLVRIRANEVQTLTTILCEHAQNNMQSVVFGDEEVHQLFHCVAKVIE